MCASQTPSPHASIFVLLATSATGPHPFPSRTRSLSPSAPMVLPLRGGGRVGRRQLGNQKPAPYSGAGFLCHRENCAVGASQRNTPPSGWPQRPERPSEGGQ